MKKFEVGNIVSPNKLRPLQSKTNPQDVN
jgi:hypothetical protein